MNVIVSLMAAGAKKNFSKEEFRRIRKEADAHYRRLVSENKDAPKALKQHTGMNIFPAIAVYKTLVRHGMEKEAATDVVRQFFVKICGIMFKPVSWYQHIGGNYHRYPAGMVKNSLRDFSPDAGFEYRMPEKVNPAVARFDESERRHPVQEEEKIKVENIQGKVLCIGAEDDVLWIRANIYGAWKND